MSLTDAAIDQEQNVLFQLSKLGNKMAKICILGAGTYGSYLANALSEKFGDAQIKMVDVGDSKIKSEENAGFLSTVKEGNYKAVNQGRFFGLGGTSTRWAGQLLFFSEYDCPGEEYMNDIKRANIIYKKNVLKRFFKKIPDLQEYEIQDGLFFKEGVWLKYSKRNFFKVFKIESKQNIEVVKGARVVKLNIKNRQLHSVTIKVGFEQEELEADKFYLTCGAFESMRLLCMSGLYNLEKITTGFRDRISYKTFRILDKKAKILDVDFCHKFLENSLVTSRIVGQVADSTFYLKAIFNDQFILIKELKNMITKKKPFAIRQFLTGLKQVFHTLPFAFYYFYHKKLYVYKNWDVFIDIELDENQNKITLSNEKDKFSELGLDIYFNIPASTVEKFKLAKKKIRDLLVKNNIQFEETYETGCIANSTDTLHPYHLYNSEENLGFREVFNPVDKLFVLHTGILKRICGVNPTASLLCLIEQHIAEDI